MDIDPRYEDELFWRFNFADGDILGLQAVHYQAIYEPLGKPEFRCGPVFVPNRRPATASYELDLTCVAAVRRARFVDLSLKAISDYSRSVLWLLYGAPVDAEMFPLYIRPDMAGYAAQCNLVEHCKTAAAMHRVSRTRKALRPWLVWLAGRAGRHKEILEDLKRGVDMMGTVAVSEYGRARRNYGKAVEGGGIQATDGRRRAQFVA